MKLEKVKLKIARPILLNPYLNEALDLGFRLPKDHFLDQLGEHFQKEGEVEKEENEQKQNLSNKEKVRDGYLIKSAEIIEIKKDEILIDIKEAECNFSDGSSVKIFELTGGRYGYETSGSVLSSNGQLLIIEPFNWSPKVGDEVMIVKDFCAFNNIIWKREDHYYRFLRSKNNVLLVDQKLNGTSNPNLFSIPKVKRIGNLDPSQIVAFNQCIGNDPVTLVQGPPGTGKTTFAAYLSDYLVKKDYSVLVTAFTHDAVNNILERILEIGGKVQKIGKLNRSSEILKDLTFKKYYKEGAKESVVGMTIHELLKNHKKFDFILVDEASQMDIVSGIHFLASSKKTIFIGDHMQLSNIPKIKDTEFSVSIFDLLRETYEPVPLLTTYRFNQVICDYISPNFYKGKLECDKLVKANFLKIPSNLDFQRLKVLCQNSLKSPLLFIHTEEEVEFLLNREHATLIADLVEDFLVLGISKNEIGVIAPNNMQVNFIKKVLSAREIDWEGIQIETVNKFQGQQKEVIVYSSVITKIGSEHAKYDFFFDIRRFNVAVSRAKKMAIVLGNQNLIAQAGGFTPDGEKIADYLNKAEIKEKVKMN
jgi:superfamily I DNA and/or RNA helicase